ncbi:MAG: Na(+)-translocating NADH-quinone reductase subunit C [Zetaproteobacteria bacterium]|nr:Na(+)-translocating NADH-quinone reductase subunit C [Pseudobdellovibrionaceae bacterium]|tara:strand:+ start:2402 stop:3202 length:801 start_codon:yes stop_codon:yes gene_type:complete
MQKDSPVRTILVAILLCFVCSILVTSAAVLLRSKQEKNKILDVKKNLLLASGIIQNPKPTEQEILEAYETVRAEIVDLSSGETVSTFEIESFDERKMSKDPKHSYKIPVDKDTAGIKVRAKYNLAYKIFENDELSMIVLPVNGKGLWSTLYGFIALAPDTRIIKGIGFYEHAETPGLGGEVDNVLWKNQWAGKLALDENYQPIFQVNKGVVTPSTVNHESKVDGLSGATITSNGVTGLVRYWLGEDAYGPYLEKLRQSLKGKRVKT